jgi:DNA-binding MarR family transcriptional regulator
MAILRAADQLRRHYAHLLAPHDLTLQQYNVLRILRGGGPAGLSTLTIADRMIEQAPGITRLLGRLVRKGLVTRQRGARRGDSCES